MEGKLRNYGIFQINGMGEGWRRRCNLIWEKRGASVVIKKAWKAFQAYERRGGLVSRLAGNGMSRALCHKNGWGW